MPSFNWPLPGLRAFRSGAAPDMPDVMESEHLISLHFDGRSVQSIMSRAAPDALVLGYTRTMMGFLLLQPAPERICMIGLGGGSLTKYCYRHLPEASITVIEINPEVIALRERFCIPPDDERLSVVCADAAQYLSTTAQTFDALLLDGFNADGAPPELSDAAFYEACHSRLNAHGVLVANLLGKDDDPQLGENIARIRGVFGSSVALAPAEDSAENIIAFAWKNGAPLPSVETLTKQAVQHAGQHDVDLVQAAIRMKIGSNCDWMRQGASNTG